MVERVFLLTVLHSWFLRESGRNTGLTVNISAVVNSALDSGVPLGREILAFVDAAVLADRQELPPARAALLEEDRAPASSPRLRA